MTDDQLISYALGHLTPQEEAAVELHLQRTPQDAAKVAGYLEVLAGLAFALEPDALPIGGEEALLARIHSPAQGVARPRVVVLPVPEPQVSRLPRRPPRYSGLWSVLAAAAVLALIYVGVRVVPTTEPFLAWQLDRYESQPGAASFVLEAAEGARALGTLVQLSNGRVYVSLERPPAPGQVYQAWDIAEAPASMGTFSGRDYLSDAAIAPGHTFGLTLEPPGGSPQPTTTPVTLLAFPN